MAPFSENVSATGAISIPDATPDAPGRPGQDGVMTRAQATKLAALTPGGGTLIPAVTPGPVDGANTVPVVGPVLPGDKLVGAWQTSNGHDAGSNAVTPAFHTSGPSQAVVSPGGRIPCLPAPGGGYSDASCPYSLVFQRT